MASEDAVYRQSSQFRLWSFSAVQLATLRTQTNALAKASIEERRREDDLDDPRRLDVHGTGDGNENTGFYLTSAEERMLLDFYTVELLRAGKFMEQPTDVQATAAVFLRRFYVTHSVMTYPPAALFKTALFFGAKSEGYYHKLDGFAQKFPNTAAADILAGEFLLCQGLRFAFDVKHPFRGLEGAVMELRRLADADAEHVDDNSGSGNGDSDRLSDSRIAHAHRRAREILKFSPLVTDAYFHYTPSQIMLAALWQADRGLVERLLFQDVFRRPGEGPPATTTTTTTAKKKKSEAEWERVSGVDVRDRVLATIEACSALLATEPPERLTEYWGRPESNNLIKPLLKKLKACRDPDRWNLVALQQAKKEGAVKSYASVMGGAKTTSATTTSMDQDATVFGKPANVHEVKRRKLTGGALDDPFGPPLR